MLLEMKVPSPGESISEVEIAEWLVKNGDYVEKDQSIAELDSDKATLELPAEESGTVKILIEEGETVSVGDIVCIIDTDAVPKTKPQNAKNKIVEKNTSLKKSTENHSKSKTTPLASAIISEHDISTSDLMATGKSGKITKNDVLNIVNKKSADNERGISRKKMSSLRRKIATRLVSVKNETAMLTTFNEVDMSSVMEIRKNYKEKFKKKHSVNLGFMSFFTKAVTIALNDFPSVNSMIDGEEVVNYKYIDIGIAVSAPKGLMVPVLRNTEKLTFKDIEQEISRLAIKAREGKITIDEMVGGTFTITNGGVFGSMLSTPIINPPQSAILGMHNIVERPVAIDSQVVVRPIMYVALSYDHRIIDGRESVGFLCKVKEMLENPLELMGNDVITALDL